jgi:hypothetical protein
LDGREEGGSTVPKKRGRREEKKGFVAGIEAQICGGLC